jgi:hypothetical protein
MRGSNEQEQARLGTKARSKKSDEEEWERRRCSDRDLGADAGVWSRIKRGGSRMY